MRQLGTQLELPSNPRRNWIWWGILAFVGAQILAVLCALAIIWLRAKQQELQIERVRGVGGRVAFEDSFRGRTVFSPYFDSDQFPSPNYWHFVGEVRGHSHLFDFPDTDIPLLSPENTVKLFVVAKEFPRLRSFHVRTIDFKTEQLATLPMHREFLELSIHCPELADDDLRVVGQLTKLRYLELVSARITDDGLAHLAGIKGLETLVVHAPLVTNEGLEGIADQPALEYLWLTQTQADGETLKAFSKSKRLRTIFMDRTRITDDGLKCLASFPQLTELRVSATRITDAGLDLIGQLPHLERLELADTQIGDHGMVALSKAPVLRSVSLGGTGVGDAGCEALSPAEFYQIDLSRTRVGDRGAAALARLKVSNLVLDDTDLSDAGLHELSKCESLTRLSVRNTKVTKDGVTRFPKRVGWIGLVSDFSD